MSTVIVVAVVVDVVVVSDAVFCCLYVVLRFSCGVVGKLQVNSSRTFKKDFV